MSAPRFFVAPSDARLAAGAQITLPAQVARHAVQVLRLRDRDPIVLFDGTGGEHDATLAIAGRDVRARLRAHRAVEREAAHPVWLMQAIVAPDVMDGIVRQAVELGVAGIAPVIAERTQRVPADRLERRVARWRQIAIAACEQCGRNRVPPVDAPVTLAQWIEARGSGVCAADETAAHANAAGAHGMRIDAVLLDPDADASLAGLADERRWNAVLVGPEGGFTPDETDQLRRTGASAAHMGTAILRADTAAVAALAVLHALAAR